MHLLSFVDDYDGSKNTAVAAMVSGVSIFDRSYNLTGAQTRYILQIYDNMENKLDITTTTPINISPPPTIAPTANLRIIVDCLKVWINGVIDPLTKRYGLRIKDLYDITAVVRDGGSGRHGDASGSLNNDVRPFKGLAYPVNPLEDASQGWIRLVRDNNHTRSRTFSFTPAGGAGPTITRTVTVTGGTIAPIDHVIMDNLRHPTFVTIGEINTRFEGFGAAWWAAAAAQDPAASKLFPAELHQFVPPLLFRKESPKENVGRQLSLDKAREGDVEPSRRADLDPIVVGSALFKGGDIGRIEPEM